MSASQLSSAMWALAVMGQVDTAPFVRAWQEAKTRGHAAYVAEGDVALTQIWQVRGSFTLVWRWGGANVVWRVWP